MKPIKLNPKYILMVFLLLSVGTKAQSSGKVFYVDSRQGSDENNGLSPRSAWQSLEKASQINLSPGDKVLLSRGCTFYGKLQLDAASGSESKPVIVAAYDAGNGESLPIINAEGYMAAIQINNGKYIEIKDLELTADGGIPKEPEARTERYGVRIIADKPGEYPDLSLKNIKIHRIFASENIKLGNNPGQNATSNMGMAIKITMEHKDALIKNVRIEDCTMEMTGNRAVHIFGFRNKPGGEFTYLDNVTILNNRLKNIGGPGMVTGICQDVLFRGNIVDGSGSSADPRMHARGSGIWPWTCNNVLIEKNKLMHARGINDSAGVHIDYNCNNVVVQYNLSMDNAGGFVEILGNNTNCTYRYNISINDGFRVKSEEGAQNDGKILWFSGYVGHGKKRTGPFNSYIYNNTIYVKEGSRSTFSISGTTEGILIANNIFYIQGETLSVGGGQELNEENDFSQSVSNVIFTNNLYENADILPEDLLIQDSNPFIGDPAFKNAGGTEPHNYIPENEAAVKDKGIKIRKIPGDDIGLTVGFEVETDFLGNPIKNLPDLGAIEVE